MVVLHIIMLSEKQDNMREKGGGTGVTEYY